MIELIRAEGVPVTFTARDGAALKATRPEPELVAEAYCAAYRGDWGDEFIRRNLSVRFVVDRLAGYLASKHAANGHANGRRPNGAHPDLSEELREVLAQEARR